MIDLAVMYAVALVCQSLPEAREAGGGETDRPIQPGNGFWSGGPVMGCRGVKHGQ